jgi:hypothetical protein
LSIQAFFFFSLSFLRQSKQAKTKKKEANQGVCVKVMTHIDLGELVGQKLKDRRFEPRSPGFISRGVKGLQV